MDIKIICYENAQHVREQKSGWMLTESFLMSEISKHRILPKTNCVNGQSEAVCR